MTNQEFAARWRDVWFVFSSGGAGGVGHYSTQLDNNSEVWVKCHVDIAEIKSIIDGHPEKADRRVHFEWELALADVNPFHWTRYHATEHSTPAGRVEGMGVRYQDSYVITPKGREALSIVDDQDHEEEIDAVGKGPIVPDLHLALYAATRPYDKSVSWPIRFLSFDRSGEKRRWKIWSSHIRYAGKKGPTTGLSHAFESGDVGDGRIFSVWVDDDGSFVGGGDEREVILVAENEEVARAFLMAGRSRSED